VLEDQEIAERAMIREQWDISKADVFLEQEERRLWERQRIEREVGRLIRGEARKEVFHRERLGRRQIEESVGIQLEQLFRAGRMQSNWLKGKEQAVEVLRQQERRGWAALMVHANWDRVRVGELPRERSKLIRQALRERERITQQEQSECFRIRAAKSWAQRMQIKKRPLALFAPQWKWQAQGELVPIRAVRYGDLVEGEDVIVLVDEPVSMSDWEWEDGAVQWSIGSRGWKAKTGIG
jgi:hypothetical protein